MDVHSAGSAKSPVTFRLERNIILSVERIVNILTKAGASLTSMTIARAGIIQSTLFRANFGRLPDVDHVGHFADIHDCNAQVDSEMLRSIWPMMKVSDIFSVLKRFSVAMRR